MTVAIIITYVVIAAYYLLVLTRHRWLLNAASLFVLQQLGFFIGVVLLSDLNIAADRVHLAVSLGALCFFIVGNLWGRLWAPTPPQSARAFFDAPICRVESGVPFNALIIIIIISSIIVSIAYYNAVGYNLFLQSIRSMLAGNGALSDIDTLRLRAYAGIEYFAPGYVNQFKNVLLPMSVAYLTARYILLRSRGDLVAASILVVPCLIFLLGTGQRGALFIACCIAGVFFNASLPAKARRKVNTVLVIFLVILLLSGTLVLGRTITQITTMTDIRSLVSELSDRFIVGNQSSAVAGFRYVYGQPPQWLDGEWVRGLESVIPGHERRVGLASEIFRVFYGSTRGTAPASIWGVAWHDFGLPGVLGLAFALGLSYQWLYATLIRGPKTLARLLVYASLSVILGLWISGALDSPINDGLITVVILMMLIKGSVRLGRLGRSSAYTNAWVLPGAQRRHVIMVNHVAITVPLEGGRRKNA